MSEEIIAIGKLFELVHTTQPDGRVFESARRAPGVRVIIPSRADQTVLLTKEFRQELGDWDYRLPGGKVFDTLDEYAAHKNSGENIEKAARKKAVAEAREEAGIVVSGIEFIEKSTLGATVEWDLYVFEATEWQASVTGQELEVGELIEANTWVDFAKAKQMIINGELKEGRIALILLQWLERQAGE